MCSASSRPTISSASKIIMQQGAGIKPFFAGVGPRALSNGLNSAVFFCFFEALRGVSPQPIITKLRILDACWTIGGACICEKGELPCGQMPDRYKTAECALLCLANPRYMGLFIPFGKGMHDITAVHRRTSAFLSAPYSGCALPQTCQSH